MSENLPVYSLKDRVVRAAMDHAAVHGWAGLGFNDLSTASGCSLAELNALFEDKVDILCAYGRMVDRAVMDSVGAADMTMPERDRLFDVLMERFDVLNRDRTALQSVLSSLCLEPHQAVIGLPHLGRSMMWMLECAGIDVTGPRGAVKVLGVVGVYLYTLKTWRGDDSADLSKTMAALDKALGKAESAAGIVNRFVPDNFSGQGGRGQA